MAGRRVAYNVEDDKKLIKFVYNITSKDENACIRGNEMWKQAERTNVLDRSWQSMKDRYLKHVLKSMLERQLIKSGSLVAPSASQSKVPVIEVNTEDESRIDEESGAKAPCSQDIVSSVQMERGTEMIRSLITNAPKCDGVQIPDTLAFAVLYACSGNYANALKYLEDASVAQETADTWNVNQDLMLKNQCFKNGKFQKRAAAKLEAELGKSSGSAIDRIGFLGLRGDDTEA